MLAFSSLSYYKTFLPSKILPSSSSFSPLCSNVAPSPTNSQRRFRIIPTRSKISLALLGTPPSLFSFFSSKASPISDDLLHNISQTCRRERPPAPPTAPTPAPACPPSPHFLHWAAWRARRLGWRAGGEREPCAWWRRKTLGRISPRRRDSGLLWEGYGSSANCRGVLLPVAVLV